MADVMMARRQPDEQRVPVASVELFTIARDSHLTSPAVPPALVSPSRARPSRSAHCPADTAVGNISQQRQNIALLRARDTSTQASGLGGEQHRTATGDGEVAGHDISPASINQTSRTIEIKTNAKIFSGLYSIRRNERIISRLLSQTTSSERLTVTEVEDFEDEEAETKFQNFTDFLRAASDDFSRPEKDPLVYFRGRRLDHDQVVVQGPDAKPLPYVRFIGVGDENEVRILHASLSKRDFRKEYFPPLRICYQVQTIEPLAADNAQATLLNREEKTLCGAVVRLPGDNGGSRTVTVGGMLKSSERYFALTAGHGSGDGSTATHGNQWTRQDVNPDDYDIDIEPPLILDSRQSSLSGAEIGVISTETPAATEDPSAFASVKSSGEDWTLLEVHNPVHWLPNMLFRSEQDEETLSQPVVLNKMASAPLAKNMTLVAGRKRMMTVRMLRKPANLRYPSGAWHRTWKVKLENDPNSKVRRGDSGAWVVDITSGLVYGHLIAATGDYAYIQPLEDIVKEVQKELNMTLGFPSPFSHLAELSRLHFMSSKPFSNPEAYSSGQPSLAQSFARLALTSPVLSLRATDSPICFAVREIKKKKDTRELAVLGQILMRTGRSVGATLPSVCAEVWKGNIEPEAEVMPVLAKIRAAAVSFAREREPSIAGATLDISAMELRLGKLKEKVAEFRYAMHAAIYPQRVEILRMLEDLKITMFGNRNFAEEKIGSSLNASAPKTLQTTGLGSGLLASQPPINPPSDKASKCNSAPTTFVDAVRQGDISQVQCWLDDGGDIDAVVPVGDYRESPSKRGYPDTVGTTDASAQAPLIIAITSHQSLTAEILLRNGANINAADAKGWTPLMHAIDQLDISMSVLLLENKAHIEAVNEDGQTALHIAMGRSRHDGGAAVLLLLSLGAQIEVPQDRCWAALIFAIYCPHALTARILLGLETYTNERNDEGQAPVPIAIQNSDSINQLLIEYGANLEVGENDNDTTHQFTTERLKMIPKAVEVLLRNGASMGPINKYGQWPLHIAIQSFPLLSPEILLNAGADVQGKDNDEQTALHYAARSRVESTVKLLLAYGADVNARSRDGQMPLHVAIESSVSGTRDVVGVLLACGADVNARSRDGQMPLHTAIESSVSGTRDIVGVLLACGADVNARSRDGQMPLHVAIESSVSGTRAIVELLLVCGADVNARSRDGQMPLHVAIENPDSGTQYVVKLLLASGADVDAKSEDGQTPLHIAATKDSNLVKLLLASGADVNAINKGGQTPLHIAATESSDTVRLLLGCGANIAASDKDGQTPLHIAFQHRQVYSTWLLLGAGANRQAKYRDGRQRDDREQEYVGGLHASNVLISWVD